MTDSEDSLLSMGFNQDGGCLSVGTARGFRICNVHPFQETFRRTFGSSSSEEDGRKCGGIARVEMLYRCNLLALVGGGSDPQYPPNKVLIWDDHLARPIGELSFRQRVLSVKLRRDRVAVALCDRAYVYNFADLGLLDTVHTGENPGGLLSISTDAGGLPQTATASSTTGRSPAVGGMVLACPGVVNGQVRVELYGERKTQLIDAHESSLAALALTVDGSLLATASEKGTVIRLFDTGLRRASSDAISTPLCEFRRGVERAAITCLNFSLDRSWLACASDRGTVHIFNVQPYDKQQTSSKEEDSNRGGSVSTNLLSKGLSSLPGLPRKYWLDGQGSYAQVRGISNPHACAFVPDVPRTLAVAGLDELGNGCLLVASFGDNDPKKKKKTEGEAKRLAYHPFFRKCDGNATAMDGVATTTVGNKSPKNGDNSTDALTGRIDDIVFGDEDGFVNVETNPNEADPAKKKQPEATPSASSATTKENDPKDATTTSGEEKEGDSSSSNTTSKQSNEDKQSTPPNGEEKTSVADASTEQ